MLQRPRTSGNAASAPRRRRLLGLFPLFLRCLLLRRHPIQSGMVSAFRILGMAWPDTDGNTEIVVPLRAQERIGAALGGRIFRSLTAHKNEGAEPYCQ